MLEFKFKVTVKEFFWATLAVCAGAAVIYAGDQLLGVQLELYRGIYTFSPIWVLDLILVPLIAGIVVSAIYGLGGKILAYFSPLLVRVPEYMALDHSNVPDGSALLPLGFWMLLVIVSVEAAAGGGILGEYFIKKIYGRRPNHLIHKKYKKPAPKSSVPQASNVSGD